MKKRRDKGRLCYYCDFKWSSGHRCQQPKLFLTDEVDDKTEVIDEGKDKTASEEILDFVNNPSQPKIFLHALIGSLNLKTMRIKGMIENQELV